MCSPFPKKANKYRKLKVSFLEKIVVVLCPGPQYTTKNNAQLCSFQRKVSMISCIFSFLFFTSPLCLLSLCRTHRSGLKTLPTNAKVHYNYANVLKEDRKIQPAIWHYRQALRYKSTTRVIDRSLCSLK